MPSHRSDPPPVNPPAAPEAAAEPQPEEGDKGERAELHRQGAKAAARGDSRESNPLLEAINLPSSTGESDQVWSSRRDAWERGRAAQLSSPAFADGPAGRADLRDGESNESLFGVTRVLTFLGGVGLTSASGFFFERDGRMHRGSSGSPVLARVKDGGDAAARWCLLGVHSSRMDMTTRDDLHDESLGLNGAWYADVLMTLTAHRAN